MQPAVIPSRKPYIDKLFPDWSATARLLGLSSSGDKEPILGVGVADAA